MTKTGKTVSVFSHLCTYGRLFAPVVSSVAAETFHKLRRAATRRLPSFFGGLPGSLRRDIMFSSFFSFRSMVTCRRVGVRALSSFFLIRCVYVFRRRPEVVPPAGFLRATSFNC